MQISRDQANVLIKSGQKSGLTGQQVLDGLITRGYDIEGIDSNAVRQTLAQKKAAVAKPAESVAKEALDDVKQVGTDIMTSATERNKKVQASNEAFKKGEQGFVRTVAQDIGQYAGAGADAIGAVFKGAGNILLSDKHEKDVNDIITKFGAKAMADPNIQAIVNQYNELPEDKKRDVDAVGGVIALVTNFIGGEVATGAKNVVKTGVSTAVDATKSATKQLVTNTATKSKEVISPLLERGKSTITALKEPSISDATKVSFNPKEALKGTGQDINVSVKGKVKKLSEVTPEELKVVQAETEKNLNDFTKQAELFKKDRSVKDGSPVEIVGKRTDQALEIADKKRQAVGKQMGEIEQKYLTTQLPVGDKTLEKFTEVIKNFENPKYGVTTQDAPVVRKLISDFDQLEKAGGTVGERLEFIRAWEQHLNDAKDAFGNFKENKTVNTRLQNAIRDLKTETVDLISEVDPTYKALRKDYAIHSKLQEIGDQLLGKDGAFGDRIKGAATVKRAIQSNSDAGARQFLTKLKEITGYDAIKEGDIALTAMENVGDYQGLSLLNILNEGKGGVVKKAIEKARDIVVGSDVERLKKYIKK